MSADWIAVDGGVGEGGGQILRTALTLSLVTGRPLRVHNIRAGRPKPGLLRQHLAAVRAAATVGAARVTGDSIASTELEFIPGAGEAESQEPAAQGDSGAPGTRGDADVRTATIPAFAVGSAGSANLVLQTILPALMAGVTAPALFSREVPLRLRFAGGTHNPFAPPFDFLERAYLPLLDRIFSGGPRPRLRLIRPGFYPAGGGEFELLLDRIPQASERLPAARLELMERGPLLERSGLVLSANLPGHIARRERDTIARHPDWSPALVKTRHLQDAPGPGNAVLLFLRFAGLTEVFVDFGRQGKPAEQVASQALDAAEEFLRGRAAVGEYLADQLLLPLALSGGGRFTTPKPTRHTLTNIDIIRSVVDITIACEEVDAGLWLIDVGGGA